MFHRLGVLADLLLHERDGRKEPVGGRSFGADASAVRPRQHRRRTYGYPAIPCTEDQPPKDVGLPYNRTKVMGEKLVWDAGLAGMPITIFRPATIYGPRSKDFVAEVAKLLKQGSMV